jgi:hypothetical protein
MKINCTKCGGSGNTHYKCKATREVVHRPCPDCEGKGGHRPVVWEECGLRNCSEYAGINCAPIECPLCDEGGEYEGGLISRPLTEDEWESWVDECGYHWDVEDRDEIVERLIEEIKIGSATLNGQPVTLEPYREGE